VCVAVAMLLMNKIESSRSFKGPSSSCMSPHDGCAAGLVATPHVSQLPPEHGTRKRGHGQHKALQDNTSHAYKSVESEGLSNLTACSNNCSHAHLNGSQEEEEVNASAVLSRKATASVCHASVNKTLATANVTKSSCCCDCSCSRLACSMTQAQMGQNLADQEPRKEEVRQALAKVCQCYPAARPTRGNLKQVFQFYRALASHL
jgi:hypothetical protein